MIPILYASLGSLVLGAGVAGWFGYDYGSTKGYRTGYEEGVRSQQHISDKEIKQLIADNRAASEIALRKANERNAERLAREREKNDIAEAEYIAEKNRLDSSLADLRERVRRSAARNPVRPADNRGRVPEATTASENVDGAFADWLVSEGGGGRVLRLAAAGEQLNAQLALCRATRPSE